jgi:hypothetical protein
MVKATSNKPEQHQRQWEKTKQANSAPGRHAGYMAAPVLLKLRLSYVFKALPRSPTRNRNPEHLEAA